MIPQERGLNGLSLFIIFYLPIIDFMEKMGYMSFFGGRPCGSCFHVIISTSLGGCFEGVLLLIILLHSVTRCSRFIVSYSFTVTPFSLFHFWFLTLVNSCALGLRMETNGWKRRDIVRWL
jgi:hypothetical protein